MTFFLVWLAVGLLMGAFMFFPPGRRLVWICCSLACLLMAFALYGVASRGVVASSASAHWDR